MYPLVVDPESLMHLIRLFNIFFISFFWNIQTNQPSSNKTIQ